MGIALMVALAVAVLISNNIDVRTHGATENTEEELFVMFWALLFLFAWAISVMIGAVIDNRRGALWGLLGPVGWIISAIGRLEARNPPRLTARTEQQTDFGDDGLSEDHSDPYDVKKWMILKEVDPEIREASGRVSAVDPKLDSVLAYKYLHLSQKEYLEPLVAKLLSDAANKSTPNKEDVRAVEPGVYETSGPFRFRILPDHSVTVFSGPSGPLTIYERFNGVDKFFDSFRSQGARPEVLTKLD
jgi:hypothetical protein